ncbi:hypothetical protein MN608_03453 [Microdochium nivale]|nr:hypothetical protein MN608_03453 [Microdochium nivale]
MGLLAYRCCVAITTATAMPHQAPAEKRHLLVVGSDSSSSNSKASLSRMDSHNSTTSVLFLAAKGCRASPDQTAAVANAEEKPISPAAKQKLQQSLLVAPDKRAAVHINTMSVGESHCQGALVGSTGGTTTDGDPQPLGGEQAWEAPQTIVSLKHEGDHASGDDSSLVAHPATREAYIPASMASLPPSSLLNNQYRHDDGAEDHHSRRPRAQSCNAGGRGCPLLNRSSDIMYLSTVGHVPRRLRQQQQRHRSESREPSRLSSGQNRWNLFDKPVVRPGCPILSVTGTDNEIKYPDDLYYYPDDPMSDDECDSD